MTPEEKMAAVMCCTWDRMLQFIRRKYPKVGLYGGDEGGQASALIKVMQDEELMARVAEGLFKIDCAFDAVADPLYEKLRKATLDRMDAERKLLETIPGA